MNLAEIIYPKKCLWCGNKGNYLCKKCFGESRLAPELCPECQKFSLKGKAHRKCKSELDGHFSAWRYQNQIRKAILALKYRFAREVAKDLGKAFSEELEKAGFSKTFVFVPLPGSKRRNAWRGFNQTEEMGKIIANNLGLKYDDQVLRRTKTAKQQTLLKGEERKRNVRGAFKVNNRSIPEKIILFDDVWTTGSTLKEAARTLKEGGAKLVWGVTIAS